MRPEVRMIRKVMITSYFKMSWKEGLDETMKILICDASDHTVQKLHGTRKATECTYCGQQGAPPGNQEFVSESDLSWPSCTLTEPQGRDLGRQPGNKQTAAGVVLATFPHRDTDQCM
jgi:hypothetical protein